MNPTDIKPGCTIGDIKILDVVLFLDPRGNEVSRDAMDIRDAWSTGKTWIRVQIQEPSGEPARWVMGRQIESMCARRRKALKGLTSTTVDVHGVDVPVSMVSSFAWDAWNDGILTDADLDEHRRACGAEIEWLGSGSDDWAAVARGVLDNYGRAVYEAINAHNDAEQWHEFYEHEPDPDADPRAEPEYWRD